MRRSGLSRARRALSLGIELGVSFGVLALFGSNLAATAKPAKAEDPGCRDCLYQASNLFATNKLKDAADLLRKWSAKCPKNSQLHLLFSTILLRSGADPKARAEAEFEAGLAVDSAPNLAAARLQYAMTLLNNEKAMLAAEQFEELAKIDPSSYEAWSSLANLYKVLREDAKSVEAAKKAAELEPATKRSRLATLKNLANGGKMEKIQQELKRLINSDFGAEFMLSLAQEGIALGAYPESIEAARKAVQSYPEAAVPLQTLIFAEFMNGDFDSALENSDKLLKIQSDNGEAMSLKSLILTAKGQKAEAETWSKKAQAKNPQSALGALSTGASCLAKGDLTAAEESLKLAGCGGRISVSPQEKVTERLAKVMLAKAQKLRGGSEITEEAQLEISAEDRSRTKAALKWLDF